MKLIQNSVFYLLTCLCFVGDSVCAQDPITLNQKASGYRGIWYMNQPSNDEYVYKYSGGLGTYCAKHSSFAIYRKEVNKTFFCYGGAKPDDDRALLHMVSYYDHETGQVPKPTILLDKKTNDAHDNPVMAIDKQGHIWIFSTSHGRARPSYIHKSVKPYDIEKFELVNATRIDSLVAGSALRFTPIDNFSYMQVWHQPGDSTEDGNLAWGGFSAFFTRYGYPAKRTICFMNSADGENWSEWQRIAAIEDGHYQISGQGKVTPKGQIVNYGEAKFGTMFNYHPKGKGLNWRTNLYYVESLDNGKTWQTAGGAELELPLTKVKNSALVRDYESEGLNVYLKDVKFDENNNPVLMYITSKGYQSGPKNDPRTWTIARWDNKKWNYSTVTTSDNNYDFGELWINSPDDWRVIGPTEKGPQEYNPGGEVAMWISSDKGATWKMKKQLTTGSQRNHTYVRDVQNAHPDFIAFWADGHGRQPSESRLYFCNSEGTVFQLPQNMGSSSLMKPVPIKP